MQLQCHTHRPRGGRWSSFAFSKKWQSFERQQHLETRVFIRPFHASGLICALTHYRRDTGFPWLQITLDTEDPNFLDSFSVRPLSTHIRRSLRTLRTPGKRIRLKPPMCCAPLATWKTNCKPHQTGSFSSSSLAFTARSPVNMQDKGTLISPFITPRCLAAAAPAGRAKLTHPGKAILAGKRVRVGQTRTKRRSEWVTVEGNSRSAFCFPAARRIKEANFVKSKSRKVESHCTETRYDLQTCHDTAGLRWD